MAIPAVLPKPKNILRPYPASIASRQAVGDDGAASVGVVFKVLGRDAKGRVETRQVMLPESNNLVVKLQKSEEISKMEKQKMKEKVLLLESMSAENEMDEESDLLGSAVSESVSSTRMNQNPGGRGRGRFGQSRSTDPAVGANISRGIFYKRGDETDIGKRATVELNLDQFLAESSASEIRRMQDGNSRVGPAGHRR